MDEKQDKMLSLWKMERKWEREKKLSFNEAKSNKKNELSEKKSEIINLALEICIPLNMKKKKTKRGSLEFIHLKRKIRISLVFGVLTKKKTTRRYK